MCVAQNCLIIIVLRIISQVTIGRCIGRHDEFRHLLSTKIRRYGLQCSKRVNGAHSISVHSLEYFHLRYPITVSANLLISSVCKGMVEKQSGLTNKTLFRR